MCDVFVDIMSLLDGMDFIDTDLVVEHDDKNMDITLEDK